jgi:hypothetical protein
LPQEFKKARVMDLLTIALKMIAPGVAPAIVLYAAHWIAFKMPRGQRTSWYSVLIAADARTVRDTHFYHIGHRNYRRGCRYLDCEVLAENPLTIR